MKKRLLLIMGIAVVVSIFIGFDLKQYLALDSLTAWVAEEPLQAGLAFAFLYFIVASLSLPGAGPLSLVAGAVFGLWYGVLIVSFASSLGATIGMLISRSLLQEWVQKRFASALEKVNKGVEKDGALYLFSMRLIPPIPFFVINLVFGLTKIKAPTFYLVSQLGMLPATMIYVNAGASLGRVENISFFEIFQPEIILSFAALIAFPFVVKLIMNKTKIFNQSSDA
ncbi:TVP38/TMEM64 family protein [Agarilytica rhodophyticola]|uniref:TVP38/TMEM64 family protein n=1 Tax=Agarilytica rhodophyticola TaxID=1737490 RepID=UPI001FE78A6E|nr:TVP38/TMEM64 family protein [Agarilytica rhodophyticola]